jgi:hypothetical protein
MTGRELKQVFDSHEFRHGLEEMSCYLASIMQERPLVYLLAKCLWKAGLKYELEYKRFDLYVNKRRIEFKFNYDRCQKMLKVALERYGRDLKGMWDLVRTKQLNKSWSPMAKVYEDLCVRRPPPDVFIWVICSRDLSQVLPSDLKGICFGREQHKFNLAAGTCPEPLPIVDSYLELLRAERPFSLIKHQLTTHGLFPSTYHFRICDIGQVADANPQLA